MIAFSEMVYTFFARCGEIQFARAGQILYLPSADLARSDCTELIHFIDWQLSVYDIQLKIGYLHFLIYCQHKCI